MPYVTRSMEQRGPHNSSCFPAEPSPADSSEACLSRGGTKQHQFQFRKQKRPGPLWEGPPPSQAPRKRPAGEAGSSRRHLETSSPGPAQHRAVLWMVTDSGHCRSPRLSVGDTSQDPQWMPEISDSTKPYVYCFFLHMHSYNKV